ncbi:MAG: hypothetical protein AAF250_09095 [Pseudomonadota bacterium]
MKQLKILSALAFSFSVLLVSPATAQPAPNIEIQAEAFDLCYADDDFLGLPSLGECVNQVVLLLTYGPNGDFDGSNIVDIQPLCPRDPYGWTTDCGK